MRTRDHERPSNPGVDLDADDLPRGRRKQPLAGVLGVEPGVEDTLDRGVEAAGNANDPGSFGCRSRPPVFVRMVESGSPVTCAAEPGALAPEALGKLTLAAQDTITQNCPDNRAKPSSA